MASDESTGTTRAVPLDASQGGMSIDDCRIVDLARIEDPRGNLTFIEGERHIPFPIARVFYLYDVPGGAERAGHALESCHQFLVAMSGSFDVHVNDGSSQRTFSLNRCYYGLLIPPLIWREIDNFSSGAVCLVLASAPYDADSYYRDYAEYRQMMLDAS